MKRQPARYPETGIIQSQILSSLALSSKSPLIKRIIQLVKKKRHSDALALTDEYDPNSESCPDQVRINWSIVSSVRKATWLNLDVNTAAHAIEGFLDGERRCAVLNETMKLRLMMLGIDTKSSITNNLSELLGSFSCDELFNASALTSGASALSPKRKSTVQHKYRSSTETTLDCLTLTQHYKTNYLVLKTDDGETTAMWSDLSPACEIVQGNYITTVPKNAKTDRVIAKEPVGNMLFQRGIGKMISRRLTRTGCDIRTGATRHAKMACLGSLDSSLCTIDLKAASDSISYEVVKELFPYEWRLAMETTRSSHFNYQGSWNEYTKWSSMGNGYTFELETALFLSIVRSVVPRDEWLQCSCFGDDIICPTKYADEVIDVLSILGFDTNIEKTFTTGSFRESCGRHYLNGVDVTPLTLKVDLSSTDHYILVANQLRRYMSVSTIMDPRLYEAYAICVSNLKKVDPYWSIPRIPDNQGDGALIGTLAEVKPNFRFSKHLGERVFVTKTRTWGHKQDRDSTQAGNLCYWNSVDPGLPRGYSTDYTQVISGSLSYKSVRIVIREWYDPPWIA